jgi:ubiquinone/menaquinone biosynthesis C-methylase UbiE
LPDWQVRCQQRLKEEEIHEKLLSRFIETLRVTGLGELRGRKMLEIGCGTGGFSVMAHLTGIDTYGIDLDPEAIKICRLKAAAYGITPSSFQMAFAEALPFNNNCFDLVYCSSVLEHVSDVKKACKEILRVIKPGGICYIVIPNYFSPYEGHYKVAWFPMMPKSIAKFYLRILRRPTEFIKTINYTTPQLIENILCKQNRCNLLYKAGERKFVNSHGWKGLFIRSMQHLYYKLFSVDAEITFLIHKLY